jgi:hypothetical protein
MIPLLRTTPGLKGHRPVVGTPDGHDLVSLFGALNLVTGQLTTRLVERPRAAVESELDFCPFCWESLEKICSAVLLVPPSI